MFRLPATSIFSIQMNMNNAHATLHYFISSTVVSFIMHFDERPIKIYQIIEQAVAAAWYSNRRGICVKRYCFPASEGIVTKPCHFVIFRCQTLIKVSSNESKIQLFRNGMPRRFSDVFSYFPSVYFGNNMIVD